MLSYCCVLCIDDDSMQANEAVMNSWITGESSTNVNIRTKRNGLASLCEHDHRAVAIFLLVVG